MSFFSLPFLPILLGELLLLYSGGRESFVALLKSRSLASEREDEA